MDERLNPMNNEGKDVKLSDHTEGISFDLDDLEKQLKSDLSVHLSEIKLLEEQKAAIANPEKLGKAILDVIWAQCINQIGAVAGDDFIKENHDFPLDLRYEAHVQTVDNFTRGEIATHNSKEIAEHMYSERYDQWHNSFEYDEQGNVLTHTDRTHKQVAKINKEARLPYDIDRPHGANENNLAMDHTVPVAEIIRDPHMATYMNEADRVAFANSSVNLRELRADWNQSKSALSMREWLETPNANGQTPEQIWNITPEQKAELLKADEEARAYMAEIKKEAENQAIKEGKQSRKEEALRAGGKALRSVLFGLLAQLVRKIVGKFIAWLKSKNRNLETLIDQIKNAIVDFFTDVKTNLMVSADTAITTVLSSVGDTLRKIWIMLKQAAQSVIAAVNYLKNPENRKKSIGVITLEVGKIIVAGLTAAGAILLGETIGRTLSTIPVLAISIPLIGSIASIIGIFLSGIIMGIAGALVMNLIDTLIAKTQRMEVEKQQIDKRNDLLAAQEKMIAVKRISGEVAREQMLDDLEKRHAEASAIINEALDTIFGPDGLSDTI